MKAFLARFGLLLLALQVSQAASNCVVNLSHYDEMQVDFATMKAQGIVGVLHEATYPRNVRDEKYSARQGAAVRAGLLWGAYHFADSTDPIRQADHMMNTVASAWRQADPASRPHEVLLVLDFEKNNHYPGGTMVVDEAVAFVQRIHARTGKYPGLYSGEYRINGVLNNPNVSSAAKEVLTRCWLWVANYHFQPRNVAPWRDWMMWQYTGDGVCDLPRGSYPKSIANIRKAERNIFHGSKDDARAFWQRHGWEVGTASGAAD